MRFALSAVLCMICVTLAAPAVREEGPDSAWEWQTEPPLMIESDDELQPAWLRLQATPLPSPSPSPHPAHHYRHKRFYSATAHDKLARRERKRAAFEARRRNRAANADAQALRSFFTDMMKLGFGQWQKWRNPTPSPSPSSTPSTQGERAAMNWELLKRLEFEGKTGYGEELQEMLQRNAQEALKRIGFWDVPTLGSQPRSSPLRHVRLSTARLPAPIPDPAQQDTSFADLDADGFYAPQAVVKALTSTQGDDQYAWDTFISCANVGTWWSDMAALPCVSGLWVDNCLSGMRRCGMPKDNARNPFLEIDLDGAPHTRRNRLFSVQFDLPRTPELRALFFGWSAHPARPGIVSKETYRVQLYCSDGSAVPCPWGERPEARKVVNDTVHHICLLDHEASGEGNRLVRQLGAVTRVRVTLPGEMRQIWLRRVEVTEVPLERGERSAPSPLPGTSVPGLGPDRKGDAGADADLPLNAAEWNLLNETPPAYRIDEPSPVPLPDSALEQHDDDNNSGENGMDINPGWGERPQVPVLAEHPYGDYDPRELGVITLDSF